MSSSFESAAEEQSHIDWCASMFRLLQDGGVWGVPRSGLMFTKRGNTFVLTDRMPLMEGMPLTQAELDEQQQADFNLIRHYFKLAGVTIIDETKGEA